MNSLQEDTPSHVKENRSDKLRLFHKYIRFYILHTNFQEKRAERGRRTEAVQSVQRESENEAMRRLS